MTSIPPRVILNYDEVRHTNVRTPSVLTLRSSVEGAILNLIGASADRLTACLDNSSPRPTDANVAEGGYGGCRRQPLRTFRYDDSYCAAALLVTIRDCQSDDSVLSLAER